MNKSKINAIPLFLSLENSHAHVCLCAKLKWGIKIALRRTVKRPTLYTATCNVNVKPNREIEFRRRMIQF